MLPRLQKGVQHVIKVVFLRQRHPEETGMRHLLQGVLERTGHSGRRAGPAVITGIIAIANFAVAHHRTVGQQGFHQFCTGGAVTRQIIPIGKMKQIGIPVGGRMMLLEMPQCHLIGRGTACPATRRQGKERFFWYHLGVDVVGDEHRLDPAVLPSEALHHPEEKAFGKVFFLRGQSTRCNP